MQLHSLHRHQKVIDTVSQLALYTDTKIHHFDKDLELSFDNVSGMSFIPATLLVNLGIIKTIPKEERLRKRKVGCRYPFVLTSVKNAWPSLKFLIYTYCM
jgi:hypothetical protein